MLLRQGHCGRREGVRLRKSHPPIGQSKTTRLVEKEDEAHANFRWSSCNAWLRSGNRVDTGRDGPPEELQNLRRARRYITSAHRESDPGSAIRNRFTCEATSNRWHLILHFLCFLPIELTRPRSVEHHKTQLWIEFVYLCFLFAILLPKKETTISRPSIYYLPY